MKGLYVTDGFLHLPQVTIVFYIPIKKVSEYKSVFTCKCTIYDRGML